MTSLLFGFSEAAAQRMALSLLCCLPKKLDAKEREDLGEQVENGQSADHDGERVGHYIVGKTIGVASHQPFLVYQVQNSKENDGEQEAVEQIEVEQDLGHWQIRQHGDHYPDQNENGKQPPEERSLVPRSSHASFKPKCFGERIARRERQDAGCQEGRSQQANGKRPAGKDAQKRNKGLGRFCGRTEGHALAM